MQGGSRGHCRLVKRNRKEIYLGHLAVSQTVADVKLTRNRLQNCQLTEHTRVKNCDGRGGASE